MGEARGRREYAPDQMTLADRAERDAELVDVAEIGLDGPPFAGMNMQRSVWLCVRIMPTPADTSQDSLPTCVAFCARPGDVASALIARAAAKEAMVRIIIWQTSK